MPTGPYRVIDTAHPDPFYPGVPNSGFLPFCSANRWAFKQGNDWYACIYDYFGHTPPWDVVRWPALDVLKSTDGGATWSLCDSGNNPWVPDTPPGLGTDEYLSVLAAKRGSRICAFSSTPWSTGPTDYSKRKILVAEFDMATGSWASGFSTGSFEMAPTLGWPTPATSIPIMYACSRSNGDVVLFHNGPKDGSGFDRIHYSVWDGSSWSTQTLCVAVANKYCYPCAAIEDENGIIHLIYATSSKDNFTGFLTDLAFYHLGIAADYSLGTAQAIKTGLESYWSGWATGLMSYPVLHGGNLHLAFTAAYGGSSTFNDLYYAVAPATLNPSFTVDYIQGSGGAWPYPYQSMDLGGGAAVAVLVGDDRDLWVSASYHGSTPGVQWRERTHYYRDSSSNPKVLWVEDWPTYPGLPAPPVGKMRIAFSEKDPVTGWTDPADYLYIDRETAETITAMVCTVEAAAPAVTPAWGYFGRPSAGYGGGFGQGWGFFG